MFITNVNFSIENSHKVTIFKFTKFAFFFYVIHAVELNSSDEFYFCIVIFCVDLHNLITIHVFIFILPYLSFLSAHVPSICQDLSDHKLLRMAESIEYTK